MKNSLLIILMLLSIVSARTWENSEGKKIEAEFVKVEGESVFLKMKGKEFKIAIDSLSAADQAFIAEKSQKTANKEVAQKKPVKPAKKKGKSKIHLDKWVHGPKLTQEDLDGKVVVFHAWNAYCARCPSKVKDFNDTARRKRKTGATYLIWHYYSDYSLAVKNSALFGLDDVPVYHGKGLGKWNEEKWGKMTWPFVGIMNKEGEIVYLGEENSKFKKMIKELLEDEG